MVTVSAPILNTTTLVAPFGTYSNLDSKGLVGVDTNISAGAVPQTVGATVFQIAAFFAELSSNTATSTVHAATLNTIAGLITTEALTTAPGANYVFTLTNSLLTAGAAAPQVQVHSGTNTAGGIAVASVVNATGSTVITITNTGTAAFNGTLLIAFHI
jgi:hypothetical protein